MKLATLNKLPRTVRKYAALTWNSVYQTKNMTWKTGWNMVDGLVLGVYYAMQESNPGALSWDEYKAIRAYYKRWFSL